MAVDNLGARDRTHSDRLPAGRYYGRVGARVESALAVVADVVHAAPRALPLHDHALDYFCMLVRGRYVETIAGRTFDYAPYQVGFHPAGVPHVDCVGAHGGRFLCLELRRDVLDAAGLRLRNLPSMLPGEAALPLVGLWNGLRAGTLTPLVLDSVAFEMCAPSPSRAAELARPPWLLRCLALIADACEEPWNVDAAARAVGIHPVHLSREFRRRFGRTFGECLLRARVRAACVRMVTERESLAATAAHAGFADHSHFCRVFKAVVGCTPSAYATRARSGEGASAQDPPRYSM